MEFPLETAEYKCRGGVCRARTLSVLGKFKALQRAVNAFLEVDWDYLSSTGKGSGEYRKSAPGNTLDPLRVDGVIGEMTAETVEILIYNTNRGTAPYDWPSWRRLAMSSTLPGITPEIIAANAQILTEMFEAVGEKTISRSAIPTWQLALFPLPSLLYHTAQLDGLHQPGVELGSNNAERGGSKAPYIIWSALSLASAGVSAYHGYKRNRGSVGATVLWGVLGAVFPVIVPVAAVATGYAHPKK